MTSVRAIRDARTTLIKTATGTFGSDVLTIPRSMFDSAIRNLDAALATSSTVLYPSRVRTLEVVLRGNVASQRVSAAANIDFSELAIAAIMHLTDASAHEAP